MDAYHKMAPARRGPRAFARLMTVSFAQPVPLLALRKQCSRLALLAALLSLVCLASPGALVADDLLACAPAELAAPVSGSLVICGGGKLPEPVLNRFVELAGGKDARIVVIPTASGIVDTPEGMEKKIEFWRQAKVAALSIVHTRSREEADNPSFSKPLTSATGVWFTGGFQWRLADTYVNTVVEKMVRAVLDRGGVVGGTSSGAAVMSPVMIRRYMPDEPKAEVGRGFGLLPGTVIDQHFIKRNRQDRLIDVLDTHPGFVGLGIDEGTALVAQGRRLSVLGDSNVVTCLAASPDRPLKLQVLKSGDEVDLVELSRAAIARAKPRKDKSLVTTPSVPHGTLVIVGGGGTPPEAVKRFIAAAGGPEAPLVVVSTAQGDTIPSAASVTGFLTKAGAKHVRQLHARNPQEATTPENLALLREAKGVWFGGGRQWRLVDAYQDTEAEKLFHEVLERGGVIGGSSAGATIQASYLCRGSPLGNTEMMAEGYERGFGFLRGVAIDQHFSQRKRFADMEQLKKAHPNLIGLGIDESTALIVRGSKAEVIGAHQVAVYDRRNPKSDTLCDHTVLKPGDTYDFKNAK